MNKNTKATIEVKILEFTIMLLEGFFISGVVLMLNEYFIHLNMNGAMSFTNFIKLAIMALIVRVAIKYLIEK